VVVVIIVIKILVPEIREILSSLPPKILFRVNSAFKVESALKNGVLSGFYT